MASSRVPRGSTQGARRVRHSTSARRSLPPPDSSEVLGSDGLTPRQREVYARPPGPEVLADLAREWPSAPRPGSSDADTVPGARCCLMCWRDIPPGGRRLVAVLTCDNARTSKAKDGPCTLYLRRCYRAQEQRSEMAKQSLLAEVARG